MFLADNPAFPELSEIVSGAANGVDDQAIRWAEQHGVPVKQFPADWLNLGRAAGPIRNGQMADYADYCIAFFDSSNPCLGTKNMLQQMKKAGKPSLSIHEKLAFRASKTL